MSVSFVDVNASCEFYSLFSPGIILWCVCRGCFSQSGSSEQHLPNHGLSLSTRWQRGYVCQTHTQYMKNWHSFLVRKVEDVCLKPACFFLKRPIGPSSSGHIKKRSGCIEISSASQLPGSLTSEKKASVFFIAVASLMLFGSPVWKQKDGNWKTLIKMWHDSCPSFIQCAWSNH